MTWPGIEPRSPRSLANTLTNTQHIYKSLANRLAKNSSNINIFNQAKRNHETSLEYSGLYTKKQKVHRTNNYRRGLRRSHSTSGKCTRPSFRCMTSFTSPIWDFYFDISEWHILPACAWTPVLLLHLTNPCAKRKVLSLTKPKGKMTLDSIE